jgi:hypothetical protein
VLDHLTTSNILVMLWKIWGFKLKQQDETMAPTHPEIENYATT